MYIYKIIKTGKCFFFSYTKWRKTKSEYYNMCDRIVRKRTFAFHPGKKSQVSILLARRCSLALHINTKPFHTG